MSSLGEFPSGEQEDNEVETHGVDKLGYHHFDFRMGNDASLSRNPGGKEESTCARRVQPTSNTKVAKVLCNINDQCPSMRMTKGITIHRFCDQMAILERQMSQTGSEIHR